MGPRGRQRERERERVYQRTSAGCHCRGLRRQTIVERTRRPPTTVRHFTPLKQCSPRRQTRRSCVHLNRESVVQTFSKFIGINTNDSLKYPHNCHLALRFLLCLLWSSFGIGQAIIFSSCGLFLSSSIFYLLSFFPRLISAAAHWMSTILPHLVWP